MFILIIVQSGLPLNSTSQSNLDQQNLMAPFSVGLTRGKFRGADFFN